MSLPYGFPLQLGNCSVSLILANFPRPVSPILSQTTLLLLPPLLPYWSMLFSLQGFDTSCFLQNALPLTGSLVTFWYQFKCPLFRRLPLPLNLKQQPNPTSYVNSLHATNNYLIFAQFFLLFVVSLSLSYCNVRLKQCHIATLVRGSI